MEWEQLNHLAYASSYKNYLVLAYKDSFHIKCRNTPKSTVRVGDEIGFKYWMAAAEFWLQTQCDCQ